MVKVEGRERLVRRMKAIPPAVQREVKAALGASGGELVAMMKRRAPVDTGALRDSIGWTFGDAPQGSFSLAKSSRGGDRASVAVTVYAGGGGAFYGWMQEQGTVKMPAHPFFFSSYRVLKKRIKSRTSRAMNKAIKSTRTG